jgi:hypothetical protein
MSNKQFRSVMRWVHVVGGALIFTFIYSSTLNDIALFEAAIKFAIIPILGISGILLWQQPRVMKLLKGRRRSS